MKNIKQLRKGLSAKRQGFTIIEVMIVLTIAGLILAIVFLAVPALQRNSRNTQRKNDASHLASLISEYEANHAGTLPTGFCGGIAGSGTCAATQVNVGSENFSQFSSLGTVTVASGGTGNFGSTTSGELNLNASCNPATNVISYANNTKAFAIGFTNEAAGGTSTQCISE